MGENKNLKGTINDLSIYHTDAYMLAVQNGYKGTMAEWLDSLAGDSAYEIAMKNGYKGTEQEWLASLKGDKGDAVVINPDGSVDFVKETDPTVPAWAKQPNPPAESDPTVPAWAKKPNPPTAADLGLKTEEWELTYEDGTTETKAVYVG